jgi:hypothetical protein
MPKKMPPKSHPKSPLVTSANDVSTSDAITTTPTTTASRNVDETSLVTSPHEKFAFSQLMRQMAQKYQDKNETAER